MDRMQKRTVSEPLVESKGSILSSVGLCGDWNLNLAETYCISETICTHPGE